MNQLEPEFTPQSKLIAGNRLWRLRRMATRAIFAIFVALAAISWEFWENRDGSQISKILSQSPQLVRLTATDAERFGTVEEWLRTLVFADMSSWALEVSRMIGNPDFRARAMASVVVALARVGKVDEAQQAASESLETARRIEDPYRRSYAEAIIVEALAKAGREYDALKMARGIGDASFRFGATVSIVEALAKNGRREE